MIEKRTVFVLGAGASCPYGFPTARGLRAQIIDHYVGQRKQCVVELESGSSDKHVVLLLDSAKKEAQDFVSTFDESSTESVDLFLSRHPEFAKTGKTAICLNILFAEKESKFREQVEKQEHDWYFYLYSRLTRHLIQPDGLREFGKSNIAFVTFNYDRSLEYFLFNSLLHSFGGANTATVEEQMRQIPIAHAYGQVGGLEWQETKTGLPYGSPIAEFRRVNLSDVIENLYVVHEERTNPELQKAREEISTAERLFFLGFGYAKENLEALGLPDTLRPDQHTYGTARGCTKREIGDIERLFTLALEHVETRPSNKSNQVQIVDCDCVALLREFL